ncbi:hypothetical protein AG1IA_07548 [Rhizoctonia solani AG-1 IA]|uniref:Uncharacterized protein n=1 Tax=Thanatephorus cucumeris (strain AG1-IA) TaxID=983506 RepID=L8WJR4_THACA|nr:hypothetical protein AG1IA_07548 [Rhizoctonia solani AG-1 IA]
MHTGRRQFTEEASVIGSKWLAKDLPNTLGRVGLVESSGLNCSRPWPVPISDRQDMPQAKCGTCLDPTRYLPRRGAHCPRCVSDRQGTMETECRVADVGMKGTSGGGRRANIPSRANRRHLRLIDEGRGGEVAAQLGQARHQSRSTLQHSCLYYTHYSQYCYATIRSRKCGLGPIHGENRESDGTRSRANSSGLVKSASSRPLLPHRGQSERHRRRPIVCILNVLAQAQTDWRPAPGLLSTAHISTPGTPQHLAHQSIWRLVHKPLRSLPPKTYSCLFVSAMATASRSRFLISESTLKLSLTPPPSASGTDSVSCTSSTSSHSSSSFAVRRKQFRPTTVPNDQDGPHEARVHSESATSLVSLGIVLVVSGAQPDPYTRRPLKRPHRVIEREPKEKNADGQTKEQPRYVDTSPLSIFTCVLIQCSQVQAPSAGCSPDDLQTPAPAQAYSHFAVVSPSEATPTAALSGRQRAFSPGRAEPSYPQFRPHKETAPTQSRASYRGGIEYSQATSGQPCEKAQGCGHCR